MQIDDDLIDERLQTAMELRRERKALARKIQKRHETYMQRREPMDARIEAIDVELAGLVVMQPAATEPRSE